MPKVSVVIPICNAEKYLRQCIDSVLHQSLTDIEVVCVDDGSKDGSLAIIKEYSHRDPRVKVITKANAGYGNSVNMGIAAASGDYIGIVESDDFISERMYETLWNLSDGETADVVKGNFWDYYDWNDRPAEAVTNTERKQMPDVETAFTIRQRPEILWGHPSVWSAIYRRNFLHENHIVLLEAPGGGWVDNPFFFETLCAAKAVKWTKEPLYYYRKTNMNSSSNNQTDLTIPFKRMMENLDILSRYHFNDESIQGFAYARAIMYLCGVLSEKNYPKMIDSVLPYAQQMMLKLNPETMRSNFNVHDQTKYQKFVSPIRFLMPDSGKILIYNWVPFDNPGKFGGGVTIYCYNLILIILRERPDIKVYFISSGWAYDLTTTECYIRSIGNEFGDRCRSFEIVNSPVPAAQNLLLNNPSLAFENETLKKVFSDFVRDCGPFTTIHFNNMEGLSLDVFELKKELPQTTFLYSLHNYVPICMTGYYFQRHSKHNCSYNHTAQDCLKCTEIGQRGEVGRRNDISDELLRRAKIGATTGKKPMDGSKWLAAFSFSTLDTVADGEKMLEFCRRATDALNQSMDAILAVSKRVRDIAVENGVNESIVKVSYIGTRIAEYQIGCSAAPKGAYFKIAYLGSDIYVEEKGYRFLLDTLESLDEANASRIDLLLTTTNGDPKEMKRRLSRFHSVEVIQGYTHSDLKHILKDVNLGVIPVLWEDNLPQIAIEMVALGVPVLSSSFGGASELCNSDLFRFRGGDTEEFKSKLLHFLNHPGDVDRYWENHSGLTTMQMHWAQLEKLYRLPPPPTATVTVKDYSLMLAENDFLYANLNAAGGWEAAEIRRSASYRVGRLITFFPRKIRGLLRIFQNFGFKFLINYCREHGFKLALKKGLQRLG